LEPGAKHQSKIFEASHPKSSQPYSKKSQSISKASSINHQSPKLAYRKDQEGGGRIPRDPKAIGLDHD
jgi:hypothetical protein